MGIFNIGRTFLKPISLLFPLYVDLQSVPEFLTLNKTSEINWSFLYKISQNFA